jgi:hypothetical protein
LPGLQDVDDIAHMLILVPSLEDGEDAEIDESPAKEEGHEEATNEPPTWPMLQ